jgi:hypothetical protein
MKEKFRFFTGKSSGIFQSLCIGPRRRWPLYMNPFAIGKSQIVHEQFAAGTERSDN